MTKRSAFCRAIALLLLVGAHGFAANGKAPIVTGAGATRAAANLDEWRDARFGLFIHWGSASVIGKELSWSRGGIRRGLEGPLAYPAFSGEVPAEVYDNLYRIFNPTKFDARAWVATAKAAGMKYIIITTRHHDGFSMFDSALSDYKVTNSPFQRDVVGEVAKACHEAGMKFGFYYSQVNWSHPAWNNANMERYIQYMHGQLRELCTRYGKIDIFWFDGACGTAETWQSEKMLKMIRALQPGILINDRSGLPGDFETPEETVGGFKTDRPWETCMTIGEHWGWCWEENYKSSEDLLAMLIASAGGDGNFLLNMGPLPTGEFAPEQLARVMPMGRWLKQYGESIYGTRGGPFKPTLGLVSTHKGNVIYVHVLDWMGAEGIDLTPIERKVVKGSLLTGGTVKVRQSSEGITLGVPKKYRQKLDTIVKLELDGPASSLAPRPAVRSGSLAYHAKVSATSTSNDDRRYTPEKALDDDYGTFWDAAPNKENAWNFTVDLGRPTRIGRVFISEWCPYTNAYLVSDFELQYKSGEAWKTFHHGTTIGRKFMLEFPPLTAREVRLKVNKKLPWRPESPGLYEFQLFAPDK